MLPADRYKYEYEYELRIKCGCTCEAAVGCVQRRRSKGSRRPKPCSLLTAPGGGVDGPVGVIRVCNHHHHHHYHHQPQKPQRNQTQSRAASLPRQEDKFPSPPRGKRLRGRPAGAERLIGCSGRGTASSTPCNRRLFGGSELRTRSFRTHFDLKVMSTYRSAFD